MCPWDSENVSAAALVVYQVLLHHSTWPFKPDSTTALTLEGLAVAITLLTGEDRFYICLEERSSKHSVYERPRNWADRCRLLFQSLCNIDDWMERSANNCRAEGDDEDLVAVLHESMPQRQKQNRERFLPVAAMLPSSHSWKLSGRAPAQAIQALLELLLVVANTDQSNRSSTETQGNMRNVAGAVARSLLTCDAGIDWTQFCMIAEVSAVI